MKLIEVFRYELEHRLRTPSTWVYAVLLFVFAAANGADVGIVGAVNANAPKELALNEVIVGMFGIVASVALFGDAALRDIEARMDPLLFTSPVTKLEHLGGRYVAAFVANAILLLAIPLGFAVPALAGYPDPAAFGPLRIGALLLPWLVFLLPNMALMGAVLFAVAALSRRLLAAYFVAFVLFIGLLGLSDLGLVDAVGTATLKAMTVGWTATELNSRLVGVSAGLLLNRLLWLAVAGGVLAALHKRFRFAHLDGVAAVRERPDALAAPQAFGLRAANVATLFGARTTARQILTIARNSLVDVAGNAWFGGILAACVIWSALLLQRIPGGPFGMTLQPVTLLVTTALSRDLLVGLYVIVCLYAGELVWKDRDVGVNEIADAAPVSEGAAFAGRILALVGIAAMLLAASMAGGIAGQLGQGYFDIEPSLYLRVLFGMNLVDIALIAVLAMAIQVVANHKYLGLVGALIALIIPFAGSMLPHYLLTYAGDPAWVDMPLSITPAYSYMNGFGPFIAPFVWYKLYSLGWALLLAVAASLLWVRGRDSDARDRLRQVAGRFVAPLRRTAGVGIALIVMVGGFILYNTNVRNALAATDTMAASRAEYAERYQGIADVPQPSPEFVRVHVEIHPHDPAVDVSGSFLLVNRTARPIDSVHVSTDPRLTTRSISLDRPASSVAADTVAGYHAYALTRPLAPGDSMHLSFDLGFRQRGFPNRGIQTDIIDNGTRFGRDWLPFVGYRGDVRREGNVRIETIVGTDRDQIAIAPGSLRREWTENGRRYFHYVTETPRPFTFTVFSGRYALRADGWIDSSAGPKHIVKLGVYHHPDHERNLDTFVRAMKASLAYYAAHFGPYAGSELRIVETPRYDHTARAYPTIIEFSEHAFFAQAPAGRPDRLLFATAHEIAHQWWGSRCVAATDVSSRDGYLWEMLANYSALMVTENALGPSEARRLYADEMGRYFTARGSAPREVSVLQEQDPSHARRALVAMYAMRSTIGEEAVNTALSRFAMKHASGASPSATALDVYDELRAVTPDSLRYLLTDLFETATVWNTKAQRAVVQPTGTGEYQVTLEVVARKVRTDTTGKEIEVPMDDWVEIGAFSTGRVTGVGEPFYLERHQIRSGEQTVTLTVPREPVRVEIDPYRTLLERYGGDNVAMLRKAGEGGS